MRVRAIAGALALAVTLVLAPTAVAADEDETETTIHLRASGSMRVVWQADPDTCAAAGICAYSGTIDYGPAEGAMLERFQFAGDPFLDFDGLLEMQRRSTVRVQRQNGGFLPAECTERAQPAAFTMRVGRAYRHRLRVSLGTEVFPQIIASGQCAGPRLGDFAGSLPSAVFDPDRLTARGAKIDLSGRFPFAAGPMVGEVVSDVVLRTRRVHIEHHSGHEGRGHTRRSLFVSLEYDVTRVSGGVTADFRAVESPACQALDACGTSGRDRYSIDADGPKLRAFGFAPLGHRKAPPLREALRRVARHGFLFAGANLDDESGRAAAVLHRPGSDDCVDAFVPRGPSLQLVAGRGKLGLTLGQQGGELSGGGTNVLRGRCPGPTQGQILGAATLARTRLSPGLLAKRRFRAVLHGGGSFATGAYRGTRSARLVVRLRRVHAVANVVREFVEGNLSAHGIAGGSAQRP